MFVKSSGRYRVLWGIVVEELSPIPDTKTKKHRRVLRPLLMQAGPPTTTYHRRMMRR